MSSITMPRAFARERSSAIPWFIWCSVASVTSAMIGAHWDISWHSSIGRDTFWTPAHMAIYLCGVLSGISCAYLILSATFSPTSPYRDASVQIVGFRGPLGAFLTSWGGLAMMTSAPFDNWWHDTYGLDVKIVSPPHVLLIFGTLMVQVGTLLLILGFLNRSQGALRQHFRTLYLYAGGMVLVNLLILILEYTGRSHQHDSVFYRVVAATVPLVFAAVARGSGDRWAGTKSASCYTLLLLGLLWVLPMFPAEPKLGPVYQPVDHFIPVAGFPLLIIIPAVALDLLWPRISQWNKWKQAVAGGLAFVGVFLAVQWPFADFLNSPAAHNRIFGSDQLGYYTSPMSDLARNLYSYVDSGPTAFTIGICWAIVLATVGIRIGFAWGDWMRSVKR